MTETMTTEMDKMQVPSGGIASFSMSDEDVANLDREQDEQLAEEVYGSEGISRFTEIASDMAGLGRFGDDVVVHAQTGELVIPKRILDESPEIREVVYQALREQGIEDPEQYVVGSGSASINPNTGLAEYGFFKSIKRVVKKVVNVVKKVAPIVLPIAMNMMFPGLGTIYGAALGSGIGTLIQGGSFKDALKSAAISGVTAAAYTGFTAPKGTSGWDAIKAETTNPLQRFSNPRTYTNEAFNASGLSPSGEAPADYRGADYRGAPDSAFNQVNNPGLSPEQIQARDLSIANSNNNMSGYNSSGAPANSMAGQANMQNAGTPQNAANTVKFTPRGGPINSTNPGGQGGADTFSGGLNSSQPTQTSFLDKAKQTVFGGPEKTPMDLYNDPNFASDITNQSLRYDMARDVAATTQKNILQKFAPYALTGGALMYATGGFDTPEDEPVDVLDRDSEGNLITGSTLLAANPDKYLISGLNPAPITYGSPKTPYQSYLDQYNPSLNNQTFLSASPTIGGPFQRVAQGGEIFPRRTGGIMPDEGIPGKDSVRAMLMPGEFVMTTDAVKGMGNGNLQQGIQNMYGVMANLERKGRMA